MQSKIAITLKPFVRQPIPNPSTSEEDISAEINETSSAHTQTLAQTNGAFHGDPSTLAFQAKSTSKKEDVTEDPQLSQKLSLIEINPHTDKVERGYFRSIEIKEDTTRLRIVKFLLENPNSKSATDLAINPTLVTNDTYRELLLEQAMDEKYENTEFAHGYGLNTGLFSENNLKTIFNFVSVKKNASKKFSIGVSNNETLLSEDVINWFNKFLPEGKPEMKGAIIIESENRLQSWACNQMAKDNPFINTTLQRFVAAANAYGEQKMLLEAVLEYLTNIGKVDQEPHPATLKALDLTNKTTRLNLISYGTRANAKSKTAFIIGVYLKENKEKLKAKEIDDLDKWSREHANKNHLLAQGWLTTIQEKPTPQRATSPVLLGVGETRPVSAKSKKNDTSISDEVVLAIQTLLTEGNKGWSSEGKIPLPHYFNREIFKQKPQIAALIKIKDRERKNKFIKCAQSVAYRGTDAVMFFGLNPALLDKEIVKTLIPWLKENPNHLFAYGIARNSTLLNLEILPLDERKKLINWANGEGKQTRAGTAIQKLFKVKA